MFVFGLLVCPDESAQTEHIPCFSRGYVQYIRIGASLSMSNVSPAQKINARMHGAHTPTERGGHD